MHSIVINTYERPESLSRCLEAISRQNALDQAEVIVVDDGSRGDFHAIERLWKKRMHLRFMPIKHAGRSAARNRGAAAATGERLIFLGDDVIVRPGWLARHIDLGSGQPMLAVLGAYPLENAASYPPAFRHWAESVHSEHIRDPQNAGFAFFATGNLSMDRQVFTEIGGFDERFRHYGWEDIDLGYRFEKAGGRIVFDEQARASHHHPKMTRADLWRREYEAGITAWQFWDKWRNDDVRFMKFWDESRPPGPRWRRKLGRVMIEFIERLAPDSRLLPRLYEREAYSFRRLGVEEGRKLYGEGKA